MEEISETATIESYSPDQNLILPGNLMSELFAQLGVLGCFFNRYSPPPPIPLADTRL